MRNTPNMPESNVETLIKLVKTSAEDLKAKDILVVDVKGKATFTDHMIFITGTSSRHVKSIAHNVLEESKKAGFQPIGMEGEDEGEWVLVDLADAVVHVMTQESRDFYQLEELWR